MRVGMVMVCRFYLPIVLETASGWFRSHGSDDPSCPDSTCQSLCFDAVLQGQSGLEVQKMCKAQGSCDPQSDVQSQVDRDVHLPSRTAK